MRVTFDSNAWERIFDPDNTDSDIIRNAIVAKRIQGFICVASFRIEAIRKEERRRYFGQSHLECEFKGTIAPDEMIHIMSIGPKDEDHPGLPPVQAMKLKNALSAGVRLMHGINWMWLPNPPKILDPALFVTETKEEMLEREDHQIKIFYRIRKRGVGLGAIDALGGWDAPICSKSEAVRYQKACAEWADGELAAAHIAYRHDILCTNDHARAAGNSIFNASNRAWLASDYGVVFKTLDELMKDSAII